jgi:hypothetical protein
MGPDFSYFCKSGRGKTGDFGLVFSNLMLHKYEVLFWKVNVIKILEANHF